MTVQCEGCGRFRVAGQWTRLDSEPVADYLGQCPTCAVMFKQKARRAWNAGVRRTRRRLAGLEPWPEGLTPADPFEGFRKPYQN